MPTDRHEPTQTVLPDGLTWATSVQQAGESVSCKVSHETTRERVPEAMPEQTKKSDGNQPADFESIRRLLLEGLNAIEARLLVSEEHVNTSLREAAAHIEKALDGLSSEFTRPTAAASETMAMNQTPSSREPTPRLAPETRDNNEGTMNGPVEHPRRRRSLTGKSSSRTAAFKRKRTDPSRRIPSFGPAIAEALGLAVVDRAGRVSCRVCGRSWTILLDSGRFTRWEACDAGCTAAPVRPSAVAAKYRQWTSASNVKLEPRSLAVIAREGPVSLERIARALGRTGSDVMVLSELEHHPDVDIWEESFSYTGHILTVAKLRSQTNPVRLRRAGPRLSYEIPLSELRAAGIPESPTSLDAHLETVFGVKIDHRIVGSVEGRPAPRPPDAEKPPAPTKYIPPRRRTKQPKLSPAELRELIGGPHQTGYGDRW